MHRSAELGLGVFFVIGAGLSVSPLSGQTACGTQHRDPGAYICFPEQSATLAPSFHLSAYGNAPEDQKITGYQVAIDGQLVYEEREQNPVRELSIETTIKGPASQTPHTLWLTITGAGSAEVSGLRIDVANEGIAPCDPLSKSPNWVCLAGTPRSESTSPFEVHPAPAEGKDLRSAFLSYRHAYQRSWTNLEFGTGEAFALDRAGNIYVASHSLADITVRKYDPHGSRLLYSDVIRACGEGFTAVTALVADDHGNVWVSGYTNSCLPTTANAYQKQITAGTDHGFVARLKTEGNRAPEFLTYVGSRVTHILMNAEGSILIAGRADSSSFPNGRSFNLNATNGADGKQSSFVALLDGNGSRLVWSTLLRGGTANALAMDHSGVVYVTGQSSGHAFVAKLAQDGSRLVYSRTFSGNGVDRGSEIAVDEETGRIYVTGETSSADFPAGTRSHTGSPATSHRPGTHAKFLLELTPEGQLIQSSKIEDSNSAVGLAAIDRAVLDAFVAGQTSKSTQK